MPQVPQKLLQLCKPLPCKPTEAELHEIACIAARYAYAGQLGPAQFLLDVVPLWQKKPLAEWFSRLGITCTSATELAETWTASWPTRKQGPYKIFALALGMPLKLPQSQHEVAHSLGVMDNKRWFDDLECQESAPNSIRAIQGGGVGVGGRRRR